jgi:hypothetical protein
LKEVHVLHQKYRFLGKKNSGKHLKDQKKYFTGYFTQNVEVSRSASVVRTVDRKGGENKHTEFR